MRRWRRFLTPPTGSVKISIPRSSTFMPCKNASAVSAANAFHRVCTKTKKINDRPIRDTVGDSLCKNLVVESSSLKPCKHTRACAATFVPLQNEYNGTCLLGVACNPLDWSPRIPIDILQKSLILGVIKQALSFSVNRDHTIVFVDLFTNKISSLETSRLQ